MTDDVTGTPPRAPGARRRRRSRLRRATGATVWGVLGLVLGTALQYLLASRGVPAPVVDQVVRALQDAMPR